MYMVVELVQGKGAPANYYSEVEDRECKEVKEVEEYEVMAGDEGETATNVNPGVQKDTNDPEEYMAMSGKDTLPPPVVTSQEPPNQTIQQTPSDGECEVRTSDVDENHMYTNVDPDPLMTKNPAYRLPPVGTLLSDHVNDEGTQQ